MARETSSCMELNDEPAAVTTTIGSAATLLTGAKSLNGSYLALVPGRIAFTSSDSDENSVVYPSGAECATASVAMMAFAPGRFSTTKDWPTDALMSCARMINVPFKGNGPALAEVMAGRVTFMFYPIVGIAGQVAGGKLKAIAVGTAAPDPDFPSVPTMAQAGFPGLEVTAPWVGMLAPAGTPAPAVNRLSEEIRKSLAKPDIRAKMREQGAIIVGDTPAEFAAFLRKDRERWAEVIKASGVRAE